MAPSQKMDYVPISCLYYKDITDADKNGEVRERWKWLGMTLQAVISWVVALLDKFSQIEQICLKTGHIVMREIF